MTAPSIAAVGTLGYSSDSGTALNTAAIGVPSGVVSGSLVVVYHFSYTGSVNTVTPPSGFTLGRYRSVALFGTTTVFERWYYKYATAADTGTYNFGLSGYPASGGGGYAMRITGGPAKGDPFVGATPSFVSSDSSSTATLPATSVPQDALVLAGVFGGGAFTPASGWTATVQGATSDSDQLGVLSRTATVGAVAASTLTTSGGYVAGLAVAVRDPSQDAVKPFVRGRSASTSAGWFTDQSGSPVFPRGDSSWLLPSNLVNLEDVDYYYATRASQGFNAAIVRVPAGTTNDNSNGGVGATGVTADGVDPFVGGSLTSLNPVYWDRIKTQLETARFYGFTAVVFLATPWGFMNRLQAAGTTTTQSYGALVAGQIGNLPNVVFAIGEDYDYSQWSGIDPTMTALYNGVRSVDTTSPWLVETDIHRPSGDGLGRSADSTTWTPRVLGNWAYAYSATYKVARAAWVDNVGPVIPGELNYEGGNNEGGPTTTNATIRRQVGWSLTNGGRGYVHGSESVWPMTGSWKTALATTAAAQVKAMLSAFVATSGWQKAAPDTGNAFLTSGQGTDVTSGSMTNNWVDPLESDYATAAIASDKSFAAIYLPTSRAITIDTSQLGASPTGFKIDPASGASTALTVASSIAAPGTNSAGDSDWLYLFTATPVATNPPVTLGDNQAQITIGDGSLGQIWLGSTKIFG